MNRSKGQVPELPAIEAVARKVEMANCIALVDMISGNLGAHEHQSVERFLAMVEERYATISNAVERFQNESLTADVQWDLLVLRMKMDGLKRASQPQILKAKGAHSQMAH